MNTPLVAGLGIGLALGATFTYAAFLSTPTPRSIEYAFLCGSHHGMLVWARVATPQAAAQIKLSGACQAFVDRYDPIDASALKHTF